MKEEMVCGFGQEWIHPVLKLQLCLGMGIGIGSVHCTGVYECMYMNLCACLFFECYTFFCWNKGEWDCSMDIHKQKRIVCEIFMPVCKTPPNPAVYVKIRLRQKVTGLSQKWNVLHAFPRHPLCPGAGLVAKKDEEAQRIQRSSHQPL